MTRLAAVSIVLLLASGCADGCENEVFARVASSDGLHEALMFKRSCGATTGHSTQVAIERPDGVPSFSGTVFVADDNDGAAPAAAWGGPLAQVRWISPTELLIRYGIRSNVYRRDGRVGDIRIRYEPIQQ